MELSFEVCYVCHKVGLKRLRLMHSCCWLCLPIKVSFSTPQQVTAP